MTPADSTVSLLEIRATCLKHGLSISRSQLDQLNVYVESLLEFNASINLISRRDVDNIWSSHILHSISPLFRVSIPEGCRLLDLGSGGGLPGIPIAIMRPDLAVSLLESVTKKAVVLKKIVARLGLANAAVVCKRAEEIATNGDFSEQFDFVIARAVAPLPLLVKWSRPLVARRPGVSRSADDQGADSRSRFRLPFLLAMKGGELDREVRETILKTGERKITVLDLPVQTGTADGLVDKKLVIVEFGD